MLNLEGYILQLLTKMMLIDFQLSVTEITRHVWKNWPETWAEERVERPDILRLIFQVLHKYMSSTFSKCLKGRFLHDDMTLDRVRLPGKKFAMHLLPRERLPGSIGSSYKHLC